jgi:hypothetical protein
MGTALFTSCSFSWRYKQQIFPSSHLLAQSSLENGISRAKVIADSGESKLVDGEIEKWSGLMKRRSVFVSGVSLISSAVLGSPRDGLAVVKQGLLAGRIPGLSDPDEQGWFSKNNSYCSVHLHSNCPVVLIISYFVHNSNDINMRLRKISEEKT